jgi:hypothetical protein
MLIGKLQRGSKFTELVPTILFTVSFVCVAVQYCRRPNSNYYWSSVLSGSCAAYLGVLAWRILTGPRVLMDSYRAMVAGKSLEYLSTGALSLAAGGGIALLLAFAFHCATPHLKRLGCPEHAGSVPFTETKHPSLILIGGVAAIAVLAFLLQGTLRDLELWETTPKWDCPRRLLPIMGFDEPIAGSPGAKVITDGKLELVPEIKSPAKTHGTTTAGKPTMDQTADFPTSNSPLLP